MDLDYIIKNYNQLKKDNYPIKDILKSIKKLIKLKDYDLNYLNQLIDLINEYNNVKDYTIIELEKYIQKDTKPNIIKKTK